MYCSNCGKKLSPDDFFCSNCGTPVLRQGLFDDNDDTAHEDAFDETRLFTAEELGQYLNEPEETVYSEPKVSERVQNKPIEQPMEASAQQEQGKQILGKSKTEAADAAKAAVSNVMGSAGAFANKLKNKRAAAKALKLAQKQEAASAKANAKTIESVEEVAFVEERIPTTDSSDEHTQTSFKKIALPVIILGLIIGLVIGLVIAQPWASDEAPTEDTTIVSTIGVAR